MSMLLTLDNRRRITLPAGFEPGELLSLEREEDGTWRLIPSVAVPKHQAWAVRSDVLAKVVKGASDATVHLESAEGKAFLRKLGK